MLMKSFVRPNTNSTRSSRMTFTESVVKVVWEFMVKMMRARLTRGNLVGPLRWSSRWRRT